MEFYYLNAPYIVNSEMLSIDEFLLRKANPFVHSIFTKSGIQKFAEYLRTEHDACINENRRIKPAIIRDPNYRKNLFGSEDECCVHVGHFSLIFQKVIYCVDDDFEFNEAQQP